MTDSNRDRTFTLDELREATSAIKQSTFSNLSRSDQYGAFVRASIDAAERHSNDSDRFSAFVNSLENLLTRPEWGDGTQYFFLPGCGAAYTVLHGDTSKLYISGGIFGGRYYLAATRMQ